MSDILGEMPKYFHRPIIDKDLYSVFSLLRRLFTFLTVSSIFIGITGFFQTFGGFILLQTQPNIPLCFSVFLMTFSVYGLNKLTDLNEDGINMPERIAYISRRKRMILYCSLGAYVLCLIIAFFQNPKVIPLVLVPIVANAAYSSRLIPGLPRLKDIPVMKNVVVAVSWAVVCTLIPGMHMDPVQKGLIAIIIYFMVVRDFIATVLYDIRDIEGDRISGVRTMPVILGTERTTKILLLLNSTLLPLLLFLRGETKLLIAGFVVYGYGCILYFSTRRDPLILDLAVDGEWTLACISLISMEWLELLM